MNADFIKLNERKERNMNRFHKTKRKIFKGVLFITFLLGYVSIVSVPVFAATVDDLRELVGDRRISDETLLEDMRAIIYKYKKSQYKNELITFLEQMGDFGYSNNLDLLLAEKEDSLLALEQSFKKNEDVTTIIRNMNDAIDVLNQLGALKKPDTYVLDLLTEDQEEEAFAYANSILNANSDSYDIGVIGEGLLPPTEYYLIVQKAFGNIVKAGKEAKVEKNTGIDLLIKPNVEDELPSKVISQFHGIVEKIEKVNENNYKVTIKHGDSLITTYENLCDLKVKVGQKVKQYDTLGYSKSETMHFEVLLNTVPINPLFLYGTAGKDAYDTWYATHPGMASEKIDFSNVRKTIISKSKEDHVLVQSTVWEEGASESQTIQMEEDYVKPKTPSIHGIENEN